MKTSHPASALILFAEEPALESAEAGRAILSALAGTALWPDRFGRYEPFRGRAADQSVEALAEQWPFHWRNRISEGFCLGGPRGGLADVNIQISGGVAPEVARDALRAIASSVPVEYGVVTPILPYMLQKALDQGVAYVARPKKPPHFFPTWVKHLAHGIPDIYWVNVFGPRYIEKIGREVLLSLPATVDEVGDAICVEAFPATSFDDEASCRERIADVRARIAREVFW